MLAPPRCSSSFHLAVITPDPKAQSSFYPHLPVSLISSLLPWQLCQHPQASNLKQTIHTAIVHQATPLATGRLHRQLYTCWQSVPEQHWFCSNQSREIAMHGKWQPVCHSIHFSINCCWADSASKMVGWSRESYDSGKHQRAVCLLERCGRPICHPYLISEWTNLIPIQQKWPSPLFQTIQSAVIHYETAKISKPLLIIGDNGKQQAD